MSLFNFKIYFVKLIVLLIIFELTNHLIQIKIMKKNFLNIFAVVAIGLAVVGCKEGKEANTTEPEAAAVTEVTAQKYKVLTDDSTIEWKGFKPTGTHYGTIKLEKGMLNLEDNVIQSGSFLIDMTSITVNDLEGDDKADLEGHLKGSMEGKEDHFFNVENFPTGAFEVTGTSTDADGKMMLSGNLALKGNKNNITIPVSFTTSGDDLTLTSEAFTIDRTKWSVNYSSKSVFEDLGDKFINDEIELKIIIKATKA